MINRSEEELRTMLEIRLEQYGKILSGQNEGYYVRVHRDAEETGGYFVFIVDDLENATDGGDYWAVDMGEVETIFRTSDWEVEWSHVA